jgi:hypothetical protein
MIVGFARASVNICDLESLIARYEAMRTDLEEANATIVEMSKKIGVERTDLEKARAVVSAANELKRTWCAADQENVDEAMDALFELLPEPAP